MVKRPKKRCEGCKRLLRTKNLERNERTNNKLLCKRCTKKEITNKFYVPLEKRKGRRYLTEDECKKLYSKLRKIGYTGKEASRRINRIKYQLKMTKNYLKRKRVIEKVKKAKDDKLNKEFKKEFEKLK